MSDKIIGPIFPAIVTAACLVFSSEADAVSEAQKPGVCTVEDKGADQRGAYAPVTLNVSSARRCQEIAQDRGSGGFGTPRSTQAFKYVSSEADGKIVQGVCQAYRNISILHYTTTYDCKIN